MSQINDFGNGTGYLYQTNIDNDKLLAVYKNNKQGARAMRDFALINAPLAASRSANAIIEVTAAGGSGNLTVLSVNGVNQIAANVPCVSTDEVTVAATWAAAINAYEAASGPKFTAYSIDEFVHLVASPEAGSTANGLPIVVTTDTGTLTATVTQELINGSSNTGVYDEDTGRKYWIDSSAGAVPNPSLPLTVTEITKYVTNRGMQSGMPTEEVTLVDDRMPTDRYSALTNYICDVESGTSDYMVFINPTDFVVGDVIFIRGASSARPITIVSAPEAGGVSSVPNPNIYLNNDIPFVTTTGILQLQYAYTDARGGHFIEQFRGVNGETTQADYLQNDTTAPDYIKNRPDYTLTYAQVEALRAASGLRVGARYNLSDKNVIVTANTASAIGEEAVYKATYGGVVHLEFCIYNFLLDRVITRRDYLGNTVTDTSGAFGCIAAFPFGNAAYIGNTVVNSVITFSTTATSVGYNNFQNLQVTIGATSTVLYNTAIGSGQFIVGAGATCRSVTHVSPNILNIGAAGVVNNVFVANTNTDLVVNGTLTNATVINGASITVALGQTVSGILNGIVDTDLTRYTIPSPATYIKNVLSNISGTVNMALATTFTDTTINAPGTLYISNAGSAVNYIRLADVKTPITFRPLGSTTVRINDTSLAGGNFVLESGTTFITLDGSKNDYAVFDWDATGVKFYWNRVVNNN